MLANGVGFHGLTDEATSVDTHFIIFTKYKGIDVTSVLLVLKNVYSLS